MSAQNIQLSTHTDAVNRGFSKQSFTYDEADRANIILQDLRAQVYRHVENFLKPQSRILELNAGTGIDAIRFASRGHSVHATDLSDGMIAQIRRKMSSPDAGGRITCQQVSYDQLDSVSERNFDHIFSNFGGLNCIDELAKVTLYLPSLLQPGGYVTWVIMPPVCPWELLWILNGKWNSAFRRLKKGGVMTHVEGEYFKTYYHSLADIRAAFGDSFKLVKSEGLAALSPPPYYDYLAARYPRFYRMTRTVDGLFKDYFPFNRWADHLIVTFNYRPETQGSREY